MVYTRRLADYVRLRITRRARPLISLSLLCLGIFVIVSTSFFSVPFDWYISIKVVGIAGTATSAWLLSRDFRRWYDDWHDLVIVLDVLFAEKVQKFVASAGHETYSHGGDLVEFDLKTNLQIEDLKTPVVISDSDYKLPRNLRDYIEIAVDVRRPSRNENKVRLMSDIDLETLRSFHGVDIEKTNYFSGISSNEMTQSLFYYANREQNRRELVCSVFDSYVVERNQLIPLSKSALSNHIGVTSLVVTADACIVLQRQGSTQVDPGKMNLGASGSIDWNDITSCALEKNTPLILQDLVRFAMEREAAEELNAKALLGNGKSRTTLVGYGRYLHRGGKPEFFGITVLNARYDEIPKKISKSERKWVITKEKRSFGGLTVAELVKGIDSLISEFQTEQAGDASMSMQVGLLFARNYLVNKVGDFSELRPI